MREQSQMESLVEALHEQKSIGAPFTLVLGTHLGKAAGVPSLSKIASSIFTDLYSRDPQAAKYYLPKQVLDNLSEEGTIQDEALLKEALFKLLESLSTLARYSLLQSHYSQIPVPRFYQDLARMIRDGYFQIIVTNNPDNLLEEAMNGFGLRRSLDYQMIISGIDQPADHAQIEFPVAIFRVLTELAVIYPEYNLQKTIKAIQADSPGGMLICGYDFQHAELNQMIQNFLGDIWFADPDTQSLSIEPINRSNIINGPIAEPNRFFGFLNLLLDQKKEVVSSETAKIEQTAPDDLESVYLQEQLRRSKNVLAQLEQEQMIRGEANGELRTQILYQQEQIFDIENRLREFQANDQQVAEILTEVAQQAKNAGVDHNTYLYLNYQARAVRRELEKEIPNQAVINTTVNATISLLERLPPDSVSRETISRLTKLAPPFAQEA